MRATLIGRILLALGLLAGTAAGVGLLVGFEPAQLPPALLNIAAYKLTFVAALGLFAAGAVFLRYARRAEVRPEDARATAKPAPACDTMELVEGQSAPAALGDVRQPERARTTRAAEHGDR